MASVPAHDLRLFHDYDLERGGEPGRFGRDEASGVAAADDEQIAVHHARFDVIEAVRAERLHAGRRNVGHSGSPER